MSRLQGLIEIMCGYRLAECWAHSTPLSDATYRLHAHILTNDTLVHIKSK